MPEYSEQDLKYADELREEIHREALAKVRMVYPAADHVVDQYPAEEYFDEGHEWWGALCLTVYDKTLDRFVVIMASATD